MNVNFYKIVCNDTGAVYVGSTIQPIEQRLRAHEYEYKYFLAGKFHFITSFTILEKNNYTIQLIDTVVCTDKKQRDILERLYILNEQGINKVQPGRDRKQHYQDNKQDINEKQKQRFICACGGKYINAHKARHMKSKKHITYLATL